MARNGKLTSDTSDGAQAVAPLEICNGPVASQRLRLRDGARIVVFVLFVLAASLGRCGAIIAEERPVYTRRGSSEVIRVEPLSDDLREEFELDPFYQKVVLIDGIPIVGSGNVSDYAFLECAWIVDHMLAELEEIKRALMENKVRIGIIAATEYTMDIPENQRPWMMRRAAFHDRRSRGLGGVRLTTCGEENLLSLHGDPYALENITIHEFAHTIASNLQRADPPWWDELSELYDRALEEGLWQNSYAATNVQEYWAEGTQSWFDCNTPRDDGRVHNGIWNREKLKKYDPRLAEFLTKTFGDGPWRYTKPTARPAEQLAHLDGLDRDQMPTFDFANSPRIQADESDGERPRRGRRGDRSPENR